ncbi:MAG: hypothetical protein QF497_09180 [Verrucomicrobiota bacterium]|nr:hypothetical protein [Verrucomicrobiota bacterium]
MSFPLLGPIDSPGRSRLAKRGGEQEQDSESHHGQFSLSVAVRQAITCVRPLGQVE